MLFHVFFYITWFFFTLQGLPASFFFPSLPNLIMFIIWEFFFLIIEMYSAFIVLITIAVRHRNRTTHEYPRKKSHVLTLLKFFLNPEEGFHEAVNVIAYEPMHPL